MADLRVSHSQLRTWLACRQKWFYRYEKGLRPKQRPDYFTKGIIMHTFFEKYYGDVMEGKAPKKFDEYLPWIQEVFVPSSSEEMQMFAHLVKVFRRYVENYAPEADATWKPVSIELKDSVILETPHGNEVEIVYIPDMVMEKTSNGTLWLWDNKTFGKSPITQDQALMDIQIPTYISILREKFGLEIHGAIFNQINVYPYKTLEAQPDDKLFKRLPVFRTPVEIDNTIKLVKTQADDLHENRNDIFMNLQRNCDRCEFFDICLMKMKGIPIDDDWVRTYYDVRDDEPQEEAVGDDDDS